MTFSQSSVTKALPCDNPASWWGAAAHALTKGNCRAQIPKSTVRSGDKGHRIIWLAVTPLGGAGAQLYSGRGFISYGIISLLFAFSFLLSVQGTYIQLLSVYFAIFICIL
jgi:hypothetical protein